MQRVVNIFFLSLYLEMVRKLLLKYSKILGFALVLTLFTATFIEWTISNELSGNIVQCEEFEDDDIFSENDFHFNIQLVFCFIASPNYFEFLPNSICRKLNLQNLVLAKIKPRTFMVLHKQFKVYC